MWIFCPDTFVSIVVDARSTGEGSGQLIARARFAGDLERFLEGASVIETPSSDYRFRTDVTRAKLAAALSAAVGQIDYSNFKDSVADVQRRNVYARVWETMAAAQERVLDSKIRDPREAR